MIIDTHAHLADPKFDDDRDDAVARAKDAGVDRIVCVGADVESSRAAVDLAKQHRGTVWATAGVHPHDARKCDDDAIAALRKLAKSKRCVAIGEIGLDYYYEFSTPEAQRAALSAQLELANELSLPVILHCRDAFDDMEAILREQPIGKAGGVAHSYTGSPEQAKVHLEMGLMLGVGGIFTFKRSKDIREAITVAPLESLLVETDSPYLAPTPYRGRRNEPAYTRAIVERLAAERGLSSNEVAEATTRNAVRLFGLG